MIERGDRSSALMLEPGASEPSAAIEAAPATLEELIVLYQDRLYSAIFRIVNHPEDAADLVQETFVRALRNLPRFEQRSSLYTWLFRIGVNLALSHRRALRYRGAASLEAPADFGDGETRTLGRVLSQETEEDPAEAAVARLDHVRAMEALRSIDAGSRALVVLRDLEDCDYDQIAQIMDVPVGTIKSRLFRARGALRERFHAEASGRRRRRSA